MAACLTIFDACTSTRVVLFCCKGAQLLIISNLSGSAPKKKSVSHFCIILLQWIPEGGGTWLKPTIRLSHHMRLVPHSTALTRWLYHPFSLAKNPSNYLKKCQITSPQLFLVVDWWKHFLFLDFTMQYSWLKTLLKLEKWLSLLVDFGKVIPFAMNLMHNVLF